MPPYKRDVQRLAYELGGWRGRTNKIGQNSVALAEFFEGHDKIKTVHWTGSEDLKDRYKALARNPLQHAGVITVEVKRTMRPLYDNLDLSKGVSFGTEFTLNTPYVQITHARDIASARSQKSLERNTGLNPRMLRVSVGTENPDELIERYSEALKT